MCIGSVGAAVTGFSNLTKDGTVLTASTQRATNAPFLPSTNHTDKPPSSHPIQPPTLKYVVCLASSAAAAGPSSARSRSSSSTSDWASRAAYAIWRGVRGRASPGCVRGVVQVWVGGCEKVSGLVGELVAELKRRRETHSLTSALTCPSACPAGSGRGWTARPRSGAARWRRA